MRVYVVVPLMLVAAACGASRPSRPAHAPSIDLEPDGPAWSAPPVEDGLSEVSNDGAGYTGEIDVYEMLVPASGRLQVSLSWEQEADYDVIVAADPEGTMRLAEGSATGHLPEYVGVSVSAGQTVYVLVAGWTGEIGAYTLETVLLDPFARPFQVDVGPPAQTWPANRPFSITFSGDLDPDQDVAARVLIVGDGREATGLWCIDGNRLTFAPALPAVPGNDDAGLHPGAQYTLQFPRAARGPRAATGEYLDEVFTAMLEAGAFEDEDPFQPPQVVSWEAADPWNGEPVEITVRGELDPASVAAEIVGAGDPLIVPVEVRLEPPAVCSGPRFSRLVITPHFLPPPGEYRLTLPGTILGISGNPVASNRLTGPPPAPYGAGFTLALLVP